MTPVISLDSSDFARTLVAWQQRFGRRDLPWQGQDPYRVWVSEIMLQQTQVATVIPYFARFLARFPTVEALAAAALEEVLAVWSGLGYYARARHLHAAARHIVAAGAFPRTPEGWAALPGVGRSTAAAICAFCFHARVPILDGNVKRVLARYAAIPDPIDTPATERRLWQLAEALLPDDPALMPAYTQAQMDLGALVCVRGTPHCKHCPVAAMCQARAQGIAAELPQKRHRALVAEHTLTLHRFRLGERWWWVLRPRTGIWAGLWCLPQAPQAPTLPQSSATPLPLPPPQVPLQPPPLQAPPGQWRAGKCWFLTEHRLTHRRLHLYVQDWVARFSDEWGLNEANEQGFAIQEPMPPLAQGAEEAERGTKPFAAKSTMPRFADAEGKDRGEVPSAGRWATPQEALAWGLPQPLRRWIEQELKAQNARFCGKIDLQRNDGEFGKDGGAPILRKLSRQIRDGF